MLSNLVACEPRVNLSVYFLIALDGFVQKASSSGEFLMDPRRPDQVWLRQARSLLHISSMNEDRHVWRFALERCLDPTYIPSLYNIMTNDKETSVTTPSRRHHLAPGEENVAEEEFEAVKSLCSNHAQKSVVGMVRGEYFLARRRPDIAARYLSQAPSVLCPFSKTALRLCLPGLEDVGVSYGLMTGDDFIQCEEEDEALYNRALQSYLSDKLRMAITSKDSVACAMLGAWLTELQLHSNELKAQSRPNDVERESALTSFLTDLAKDLDAQTTIRVLQSHDVKAAVCAPYAAASGDIGTAVNAALSGNAGKVGLSTS